MGGYNTGSKIGEKIVDKYRQLHNPNETTPQPSVNTVPIVQKDNNIFEDIQL